MNVPVPAAVRVPVPATARAPEPPLELTASTPPSAGPLGPNPPPPTDERERELPLPDDEPEPEAVAARPAATTDMDRWRSAVDALRHDSPRHGKSLSFGRFLGFTEAGVRIAFSPEANFHRATVFGISRQLIEDGLTKHFGKPTKLVEDTSAAALQTAPKSIAEQEQSDRQVREKSIEAKVREHPAVRNILRVLGGSIEHIQFLEPAPSVEEPTPSAPTPPADDE